MLSTFSIPSISNKSSIAPLKQYSQHISFLIILYSYKSTSEYLLNEIKLHKNGANDIIVPDVVMQGNDEMVLSFLAGALDNDGTINKTSFKYSTVSETLANQMMKLFSRVGFFPSLHKTKRDKNRQTIFDITDSFRKNQPTIPSAKIKEKNAKITRNSKYSTPYTMNNCGLNKSNSKHLEKIAKNKNIGLYTYLNSDIKPFAPIIFDKIKTIEFVGEEHVYDIGLEKEHLFNCNGFYVSNSRKGALIMSLDIWHKEAEDFIKIKSERNKIEKANLSLEIDDEFMEYVKHYYETGEEKTKEIHRVYDGNEVVYEVTPIRLYKLMMECAYDWAEPGCIFTNRFRNYNMMQFHDEYEIETCNPCKHICMA